MTAWTNNRDERMHIRTRSTHGSKCGRILVQVRQDSAELLVSSILRRKPLMPAIVALANRIARRLGNTEQGIPVSRRRSEDRIDRRDLCQGCGTGHCASFPAMLSTECRKRQIWCGLAQVLS
ncbi:hypothetical protein F7R04_15605 [Agrobacterium radiobacter]|nr:hypothetical protein F7R04_15605 [Agrobacterium tumefaciens]